MLTIFGTDIDNNCISLPQPLYLAVNQEDDVPADDLTVTFPLIYNLQELKEISLKENNQLIFRGIVDEQQTISDEDSAFTKIIARSMAALLLDNESKPVNYTNPTTGVIFSKHLKPLGFSDYIGNEKTYYGILNVPKGTTHWKALYNFGINSYGRIPRIEADGVVNFNGVENDEIIIFSNSDGVKYNSIKENNIRCNLISKVLVKASETTDYITTFKNSDAVNRGVTRVRYLDATTASTSVHTAEKMIDNSIENSYEITLICPGRLLNIIGAKAQVDDRCIGIKENLYVSSIHYKLSSSGEFTTVKLKKER